MPASTIHDVAKMAGVSTATVSHVLNKTRKVNPETMARVEQAIRSLEYRPNAQARGLKTGIRRQIGVLNVYSIDPYFSEVLCGIEQAAHPEGYGVLIGYSEGNADRQTANLELLLEKGVDGIIINSLMTVGNILDRLADFPVPLLALQFHSEKLPAVDVIQSDDYGGAYQATMHLIGLGHARIATIAGFACPEHSAYRRREGYEQALRDSGLPVRDEFFLETDYSITEGGEGLRRLRGLAEPPTAFFAWSDLLAIGAVRAAYDQGLSVPRDISIIGFDDIHMAAFTVPRLTTMQQEKTSLGRMAFERLRERIVDPALPPQRIVLPTHLIERESCGPAPAK